MSYRILPDKDLYNTESQCNNVSCPTKTIYWNPQVVHSQTGRMTPLNEPFIPQQRAPQIHRCMRDNPPPNYVSKYDREYNHSSPREFPSFVKSHYYEMHTFGKCLIENCRVYHHK